MWESLGEAVCLMLIIEGILPFLYPGRWRRMVVTLATTSDGQLRLMGLVCMLIGVFSLFLIG